MDSPPDDNRSCVWYPPAHPPTEHPFTHCGSHRKLRARNPFHATRRYSRIKLVHCYQWLKSELLLITVCWQAICVVCRYFHQLIPKGDFMKRFTSQKAYLAGMVILSVFMSSSLVYAGHD